MATVDPKKKKNTLLTPMNTKLGLDEGTTTLQPSAPTLRGRIQGPLGLGLPHAANIAMEERRKEEEGMGNSNTRDIKKKKKPSSLGDNGAYTGSAYIK